MSVSPEQSFMKALFHGVIAEGMVVPLRMLGKDEESVVSDLVDRLRRFGGAEIDAAAIDAAGEIPARVREGLAQLGVFGLTIPEKHGGLGLSQTGAARVLQELGSIDASVAVTVGAHLGIGITGLASFGTEAQKARLLPTLASGQRLAAFALTEPRAGSDAASIITRAERSLDGAGHILNGTKVWITNGGIADLFTVFARTGSATHHPRMAAFLVERGRGVVAGAPEETFGVRGASITSLNLEDAKVASRNLLGQYGRGFELAMKVLNQGRLSFAATCLGGCRRLLVAATERAMERRAFGRPIGEFGMTKDKIAWMACNTYAVESVVYLTSSLVDAGVDDYSLESAICKVFSSETYWSIADQTMQIAAGIGFAREYPFERMLRDARVHLVLQGTNEIMRAFIALSGMRSPGARISEVEKAMQAPIKGFGVLTDFAVKRARTAFGRERLEGVHPLLKSEAVLFEEGVTGLSREVERVLRKHGTDVADKQFVQRRISQVAIDLYALAAVLSRTTRAIEAAGAEGARREIDLCTGFAQLVSKRLFQNIDQMEREEDELFKHIASTAYQDGGYPFDILR